MTSFLRGFAGAMLGGMLTGIVLLHADEALVEVKSGNIIAVKPNGSVWGQDGDRRQALSFTNTTKTSTSVAPKGEPAGDKGATK